MRLARWAVASLLLVALAAPYWPRSVDDVYIPLAYASEWLEGGELRWTSGERVEGYSNFAWLVLLRFAVGFGLDGAVAAKLLALGSAVGVLALASRHLPKNPQGHALLLAMALWAPLGRWATDGMETVFYALLLATGWVSTLVGRWSLGMWLLVVASLTRPEAIVYVALAAVVGWWRGDRSGADGVAGWAALGGLAGYHAARVWWFGALLPTPILVKIAPIPLTHYGWVQAGAEILTAGGILVGALAASRPSGWLAALALVPLVWQTTVLGRASGDWMTGARLVLPGVLATAVAWSAVGRERQPHLLGAALTALCAVVAGAYLPVGYGTMEWVPRDLPSAAAPFEHYGRGLDTPLEQDVVWVVQEVPEDDTVFVPDVGMLGNVPALGVKDMRGLVQREISEAIAEGPGAEEQGIRAYMTGPNRPSFFRVAAWGGAEPPAPPAWMLDGYSLREEFAYSGGTIRWYAAHARRPSEEVVLRRWQGLHARFPSHPVIAWHHALALADAGRWEEARRTGVAATERWPHLPMSADFPASLDFPKGPRPLAWVAGRGLGLYWNAEAGSRPMAARELQGKRLRLDVDDPGADGAHAQVTVEAACGRESRAETIHAPRELLLTPPACADASDSVRVAVAFTNDTAEGGDRNLYVSLVEP